MRVLVDTQILLWQITDDERLVSRLRAVLEERSNDIVVSDVSIWEVVIKHSTNRLTISPHDVEGLINANVYSRLDISRAHILGVGALPPVHRDPFDRLLIAQAIVEDIPILTADKKFAAYPVRLATD